MVRKQNKAGKLSNNSFTALPGQTKRAVVAVLFVIVGIFLTLSALGTAGPAGGNIYDLLFGFLGVGYFLLPVLCFMLATATLREQESTITLIKGVSSGVFFLAALGFVAIVSGNGGLIGQSIATPLIRFFDIYASLIALGGLSLISLLVLLEGNLSLEPIAALVRLIKRLITRTPGVKEPTLSGVNLNMPEDMEGGGVEDEEVSIAMPKSSQTRPQQISSREATAAALQTLLGEYTPPPLNLLERDRGRPGVGDIKGNANIIKRTLQNFGITVELDEISIGPSVTRYAIKPAEGVRLQKIVSLQTNLELALAAHPVRIEAPIPGKSLVGIEVPNSAKVTVGLGTILESPEFAEARKPLLVALGRDIAGASHFGNIGKMPHILIAGATGSGKSVTIHTVITSLLYRLGPARLRFLMIDPKRVELTLYNPIPHLLSPVITDAKRAITALRWAGKEMERRYNILEENRVRDIDSYHENILAPALERLRKRGGEPEEGEKVPEAMPYIVIVLDELADIMTTYPRELEASIVRLAQMSRAVGIHLILSTQRPSVNVITGLIKANV
ncbi:MAG: putative cell division FtsK/SpoIIIE, partial [Parcubacteria group bacterium Gr01-1014_56]